MYRNHCVMQHGRPDGELLRPRLGLCVANRQLSVDIVGSRCAVED